MTTLDKLCNNAPCDYNPLCPAYRVMEEQLREKWCITGKCPQRASYDEYREELLERIRGYE